MQIEEYSNIDKTFTKEVFTSRMQSYMKRYFSALSLNKLTNINYFLSKDLQESLKSKLDKDTKDGKRTIYAELNVDEVSITNIREEQDSYKITCNVLVKYLKDEINLNGTSYTSDHGARSEREFHNYEVSLSKSKDAKEMPVAPICPSCGHPINVDRNGNCLYCKTDYPLYLYDFIVTSIKEID